MSDPNARPKWYGTARQRAKEPKVQYRKPQPVTPGEGRELNGHFTPGHSVTGKPPTIETQVKREQSKLHKSIKAAIAADHPDALNTALAELVRLTTEGDTHVVRLAAIRELLNRFYGKPREHKTIKRTGDTNGTTFNVQMFGADGARILEAVQSPEDRYRLAAMIDQMGQLEQNTIDVTPAETEANGQEGFAEDSFGPRPDVPTDNGIPM